MSKRTSLLIVAMGLLTIAMLWALIPAGTPKTDPARYERWKHTSTLIGRVSWCEKHLPNNFDKLLRLPTQEQKYWDEHEKLGNALVTSGYLTNVMITATSLPTNNMQRLQISARLDKAFQGRHEWEFWVSSHHHAIVVTCRPQDEALCRQALQE